jgi:hypothetical protein
MPCLPKYFVKKGPSSRDKRKNCQGGGRIVRSKGKWVVEREGGVGESSFMKTPMEREKKTKGGGLVG